MNAIQQSIDEMEMQEWENDEDENTDTPGVTFYFNNYTESFKPPHAIVAPTPAPIENTNFFCRRFVLSYTFTNYPNFTRYTFCTLLSTHTTGNLKFDGF